ncbi:hypothetical protein JL721_8417 [Aureococcus anophagefferens]|nr:hypothetical protein JL721_8417 [Aureococcus anophagefferens]
MAAFGPSPGPMPQEPTHAPQFTGPNPGPLPLTAPLPGPARFPALPETLHWEEAEWTMGETRAFVAEAAEAQHLHTGWTAIICGHNVERDFDDDAVTKALSGHLHARLRARLGFEDNLSAVGGPARAELLEAHVANLSDVYEGYRHELPRKIGDPHKTETKILVVAYSYGCAVARKWISENQRDLDVHGVAFVCPPVDAENAKAPGVGLIGKTFLLSHAGDFPSILAVVGERDDLCGFESFHKRRGRAAVNTQILPGAGHALDGPGDVTELSRRIHEYASCAIVDKNDDYEAGMVYLPLAKEAAYVLCPEANVGAAKACEVVDLDYGLEGRVVREETVVCVLKRGTARAGSARRSPATGPCAPTARGPGADSDGDDRARV